MKKTFLLVDTMNYLFRGAHVTRSADPYDKIGLALHIMLNALPFTAKKFDVTHVVFCFEGKSWRKEVDPRYKKTRQTALENKSAEDKEVQELLYTAHGDLKEFIEKKTNTIVLQHPNLEADDLIAGWIQQHPDDDHVILSSDSDFRQLLAPNVMIYDGVGKRVFTEGEIRNEAGKLIDNMDPAEYYLFEKIIRGDATDNIRPAYPGVRKKGTKNKVGILEAYADRHNQGFAWNNFMQNVWSDENGDDHVVRDAFNHNKLLIDLTAQPDEVKEYIEETIKNSYNQKKVGMVAINFARFCKKYDLVDMAKYPDKIVELLSRKN